jgi:hypothetical protein
VAVSVLERLRRADDQAREARAITLEIATWLRNRVNGLEITSFHGSLATTEQVLTELGRSVHA